MSKNVKSIRVDEVEGLVFDDAFDYLKKFVKDNEEELVKITSEIKSRKGNKRAIIGSLNQQIVFNRKKRPSYAKKMVCARNKVSKRLGNAKK